MFCSMKLFSLLVISFVAVHCLPTKRQNAPSARKEFNEDEAYAFLVKYGYVDESTSNGPVAMTDLSESLKKMQRLAGIKETGYLDDETIKLMKSPRCGMKDLNRPIISKRFALGKAWRNNHLKYAINSYPKNVRDLKERQVVDHEIALAFKYWSDHADLSFRRVSSDQADIQIDFFSGDHGDGYPFEGRGYVLGHAFFPEIGLLHMDNDEIWNSIKEEDQWPGMNLFQVMVHEIGHVIGIDHSKDTGAIMYPYYKYNANFQLGKDDINAVQALYGSKQESNPQTTTKKVVTTSPTVPTTTRTNPTNTPTNPTTTPTNPTTTHIIPVHTNPTTPSIDQDDYWYDWYYEYLSYWAPLD